MTEVSENATTAAAAAAATTTSPSPSSPGVDVTPLRSVAQQAPVFNAARTTSTAHVRSNSMGRVCSSPLRDTSTRDSLNVSHANNKQEPQQAMPTLAPALAQPTLATKKRWLLGAFLLPDCDWRQLTQRVVVLLLIVGGAFVALTLYEQSRSRSFGGPVVKYHLVNMQFAAPCTWVLDSDIRSGKLQEGSVDLAELRRSLLYHMDAQNRSIMCAQHVGKSLCYCTMHTKPAPGPAPTRTQYEDVFNLELARGTLMRLVESPEHTLECATLRNVHRFERVYGRYLDGDAQYVEGWFDGRAAVLVQYALELQKKLSTCERAGWQVLLAYWQQQQPQRGDDEGALRLGSE